MSVVSFSGPLLIGPTDGWRLVPLGGQAALQRLEAHLHAPALFCAVLSTWKPPTADELVRLVDEAGELQIWRVEQDGPEPAAHPATVVFGCTSAMLHGAVFAPGGQWPVALAEAVLPALAAAAFAAYPKEPGMLTGLTDPAPEEAADMLAMQGFEPMRSSFNELGRTTFWLRRETYEAMHAEA